MILSKYLEELHNWYRIIHVNKDWASVRIIKKIEENLDLKLEAEAEADSNVCMANSPEVRDEYKDTFTPIDLLDYIYAVLHSPGYREKYKEFLKIDFPRVPYPTDPDVFWQLAQLGGELRELHLLESPKVEEYITTYPKDGSNEITTKISKKDWEAISPPTEGSGEAGKIWINDTQYFDDLP